MSAGPFRDDLDSANASIARLEAKIAAIRSQAPRAVRIEWWLRRRPAVLYAAVIVVVLASAVLAFEFPSMNARMMRLMTSYGPHR